MDTRRKPKASQSVVIGMDFGTTFSGVAWARSNRADGTEVVTEWEATQHFNTDKQKCPTVLSYLPFTRRGGVPRWGYGVTVEDAALKYFKLMLLDEEHIPESVRNFSQYREAKAVLAEFGKGPTEAIAEFLKALWSHTLATIERATGKSLLDSSTLNIVVTLPAIWPHYAQIRMREAIEMAGILKPRKAGKSSLTFISEPEAAAMATLDDLSDRSDLKAGDHIVVCDAGGGTVDIITYMVVKIDPLTVRESVKGDGRLCGGVILDEAFTQVLRELIPKATWDKLGPRVVKKLLNDEWEHGIKPSFRNNNQKWNIQIPFGGTREDGFHPPEVNIQIDHVRAVFEKVVPTIEELVNHQIDQVKKNYSKTPKFLVLVGGLGKSVYLYDRLNKSLGKGTEILQGGGERPWTAVCRGAVMKGLAAKSLSNTVTVEVESRVARASYGTLFNALPFDAKDHDPADRAWCEVQQSFLAVEQTKWFLVIGQKLASKKPIFATFWQDVEHEDDGIELELVVSDADEPPIRKDSAVKHLCLISIPKVPMFSSLPVWLNTEEKEFRRFTYQIQMVWDGASLDVGVYFKGKRLGSKNVSIEFTSDNAGIPEV